MQGPSSSWPNGHETDRGQRRISWRGGGSAGRSQADLLRGVRLQAGTELVDDAPDRLRPVDRDLLALGEDVGPPIEGLVWPYRAFSHDGSLFAVSSGTPEQPDGGGPLRLIDAVTGEVRWTVDLPVRAQAFAFDLEAGHLVAGTLDGRVVTLALADGTVLSDVASGVPTDLLTLSLRHDGLVVATGQGQLSVVDRFTGPVARRSPCETPHRDRVTRRHGHGAHRRPGHPDLRPRRRCHRRPGLPDPTTDLGPVPRRIPDGPNIRDDSVNWIDVGTGERETYELRGPDGERFPAESITPRGDGSLVTAAPDLTVARWVDGELVSSAAPDIGSGGTLDVSAGFGDHMALVEATAGGVSTIHRYRVEDDVRLVGEVPFDVGAASVWPTGSSGVHVLTTEGEFRTYDDAGELVRRFDAAPGDWRPAADATPDGEGIVFGGNGLVVIDPEEERSLVITDVGTVVNLALTPDGTRAIVGARDGVYRLWDPEEGRPTGVLYDGSPVALGRPGIEEDGRFAWLSTPGRAIRVPIEPPAWIERACEVVDRELTDAEWDAHVPGDVARGPVCDPA